MARVPRPRSPSDLKIQFLPRIGKKVAARFVMDAVKASDLSLAVKWGPSSRINTLIPYY